MTKTGSRTWFITGVSGGIGRALAETVLARGDTVYGTLRQALQREAFEALAPGRAHAVLLDVTRTDDVAQAARRMAGAGPLDVLVNNAGYGMVGTVEETSIDEARQLFDTNFFGALQVVQAFLPQLRAQQRGHIINVSSGVGLMGLPGMPIYSASKFALEGLTEALAGEVAGFGIQVSMVEPGAVLSNFTSGNMAEARGRKPEYAAFSGHGRAGLAHYYQTQAASPTTVAQAIVHLAGMAQPPLRLLVGSDVTHAAQSKRDAMQALLDAAANPPG